VLFLLWFFGPDSAAQLNSMLALIKLSLSHARMAKCRFVKQLISPEDIEYD
jgi:hypothetical protein